MPGSQRSRNIAVFGRFCGPRSPFLWAPARAHVRALVRARSLPFPNLANLPLRVSASRYLAAPSFHGDSNKSTGFYSCLSDILYSAGPGGPHRPLLSPSPAPTYARAIRYKRRQQCICAKYKEQRPTSEAPCSGPYLLDSLHATRFHASRGPTETYLHRPL